MSFKEQIANMTWSYSRLSLYEQCPYAFYLQYLCVDEHGKPLYKTAPNFYAAYGSFCHNLIMQGLIGEMSLDEVYYHFQDDYDDLTDLFPYDEQTAEKYFLKGLAYFGRDDWIDELRGEECLAVEEKLDFKIGDYPFVGYVDLATKDNGLMITDHKSQQSVIGKRGNVLKSKENKLLALKRQMYLYSVPCAETFAGTQPDGQTRLRVNFFNDNHTLIMPWEEQEYKETQEWAVNTIQRIEQDESFEAMNDYFFCHRICQFRPECEFKDGQVEDNTE